MNNDTERDLRLFEAVEAVKQGVQAYSQSMYDLSYPYVLKCIYDLLKDRELSERLVQSTMNEIYGNLYSLTDVRTFYSYAGQLATDTVLIHMRSTNPNFMISNEDEETVFAFERASQDTEAFIPESILTDHEKMQMVEAALEKLTMEQRICVQYFYCDELSLEQIAERLSCTKSMVYEYVTQAKAVLKDALLTESDSKNTSLYSLAGIPVFTLILRNGVERFLTTGILTSGTVGGASFIGGQAAEGIGAVSGATAEGSQVASGFGVSQEELGRNIGEKVAKNFATKTAGSGTIGSTTAATATVSGAATGTAGAAIGVKIAVAAVVATVAVGGFVNEASNYSEELKVTESYLEENPYDYLYNVNEEKEEISFGNQEISEDMTVAGTEDSRYPFMKSCLLALGAGEESVAELFASIDEAEEETIYAKVEEACKGYENRAGVYENVMSSEQYESFLSLSQKDMELSLVAVFDIAEELRGLEAMYGMEDEALSDYISLLNQFMDNTILRYEMEQDVFANELAKTSLAKASTADIEDAYAQGKDILDVLIYNAVDSDDTFIEQAVTLQNFETQYYLDYLSLESYVGSEAFTEKYTAYQDVVSALTYVEEIRR